VVHVDNVKVGEARMPATETVIDDMMGDAGGLYVGGVPRQEDFHSLAASLKPLTPGCISQLVINDQYVCHVYMSSFLSYLVVLLFISRAQDDPLQQRSTSDSTQ